MLYDLEIECWKGTHTLWAAVFAIPMIVVCFALPGMALLWMLLNRKNQQKEWFKRYFVFLYQGLRPQRGYWEMCNILRKVVVIAINVFIPRD